MVGFESKETSSDFGLLAKILRGPSEQTHAKEIFW